MPSDETMLGKAYPDGATIIRQGDPGDCMFVVQSGTVEVVREEDGTTTVLAELGPNDFFGEMSLFEHQNRSATVRAKRDARVLTVDRKTLFRRIQNDPSLALNLLRTMSHRIRELDRELATERRRNARTGTGAGHVDGGR
jgi:CRP-like cAMP-binding protein